MTLDAFFHALQATAFATEIRRSDALFPWIECVHVLANTFVVGSIIIVDLRLLGWASMDRPPSRLMADVLPLTWGAFGVAALTGAFLFASRAVTYSNNFYFQGKFAFLILAGINMAIVQMLAGKKLRQCGPGVAAPPLAGIGAGLSVLLWVAVVAFGRIAGFTIHEDAVP